MDAKRFLNTYFLPHVNPRVSGVAKLDADGNHDGYEYHRYPPSEIYVPNHLDGIKALAISLAINQSQTRMLAFDCDWKPVDEEVLSHEDFLLKIQRLAHRIAEHKPKCHPLIVQSRGGKGRQIYLRWDKPKSIRDVRVLALRILEHEGYTEGTGHVAKSEIEIFPSKDYYAPDDNPELLALPFFDLHDAFDIDGNSIPLPEDWTRSQNPPPAPPPNLTKEQRQLIPDELYDLATVEQALEHIDSDDYGTWLSIGLGLKRTFGDDAFPLFDRWSQQSDRYDAAKIEVQWRKKLKMSQKARPITVGSIIYMAKDRGWMPPEGVGMSYTDLGMARLFANQYGEIVKWCSDNGKWYAYDESSGKWDLDENKVIPRRLFAKLTDQVRRKAQRLIAAGADIGEALDRFARKYEAAGATWSALQQAESLPSITVKKELFDRHTDRILAANGKVLRFTKDGIEIRDAQADDFFSMSLGVGYDPQATCLGFDKYFGRFIPVLEGTEKNTVGSFVIRHTAVCLAGQGSSSKRFIHFTGSGDNGKTVWFNITRRVFGDYGHTTSADTFARSKRRSGAATPELMAMDKKRIVHATELSDGMTLDEERIRMLTGGDSVSGRALYENSTEFAMVAGLQMHGNEQPRVKSNLPATWSRIALVECQSVVPKHEQVVALDAKLIEVGEGPGILNYLLKGWKDYRERGGLDVPAVVRDSTAEYRAEQDHIKEWFTSRVEQNEQATLRASDAYEDFTSWWKAFKRDALGETPSKKAMSARLVEMDCDIRWKQGNEGKAKGWKLKFIDNDERDF